MQPYQSSKCSIEGCDKPHMAGGWCKMHWTRWRRHGDPFVNLQGNTPESFWAKTRTSAACWIWGGKIEADGYGRVSWHGRHVLVHRLAYELTFDPGRSGGLQTGWG